MNIFTINISGKHPFSPGHFCINLQFNVKKSKSKWWHGYFTFCKFFPPQLKTHSLLILTGEWDGKGSGEASSWGVCSGWIATEQTQGVHLVDSSSKPSGYPREEELLLTHCYLHTQTHRYKLHLIPPSLRKVTNVQTHTKVYVSLYENALLLHVCLQRFTLTSREACRLAKEGFMPRPTCQMMASGGRPLCGHSPHSNSYHTVLWAKEAFTHLTAQRSISLDIFQS